MGYGDFSLLITIRDASADGEVLIADFISDFPESMIATAIRQKTIDASDDGLVRLTESGRQAIRQFHTDKSAEWGWPTDLANDKG